MESVRALERDSRLLLFHLQCTVIDCVNVWPRHGTARRARLRRMRHGGPCVCLPARLPPATETTDGSGSRHVVPGRQSHQQVEQTYLGRQSRDPPQGRWQREAQEQLAAEGVGQPAQVQPRRENQQQRRQCRGSKMPRDRALSQVRKTRIPPVRSFPSR